MHSEWEGPECKSACGGHRGFQVQKRNNVSAGEEGREVGCDFLSPPHAK